MYLLYTKILLWVAALLVMLTSTLEANGAEPQQKTTYMVPIHVGKSVTLRGWVCDDLQAIQRIRQRPSTFFYVGCTRGTPRELTIRDFVKEIFRERLPDNSEVETVILILEDSNDRTFYSLLRYRKYAT